jgi:hypothetical protein
MSMFLLVLAFLLIGVPGTAFVILQLISAHRRQALAYRWSASEIQRRGARITEMERATANDRKSIGELMMKISTLRMTVDRLEKLIEQSGKPAPTAAKK